VPFNKKKKQVTPGKRREKRAGERRKNESVCSRGISSRKKNGKPYPEGIDQAEGKLRKGTAAQSTDKQITYRGVKGKGGTKSKDEGLMR